MNKETLYAKPLRSSSGRHYRPRGPSPSVAEPRRSLLLAALAFVLAA